MKPTVIQTKTIVLAPPSELTILCTPERIREDTVKALARGYIVNTNQIGVCNDRIQGIIDYYKAQQEIYNGSSIISK